MDAVRIEGTNANPCLRIAELVKREGGHAFLVGGWVRDTLLNVRKAEVDADVEVFGVPPGKLLKILTSSFSCDLYGKSFQVIKLKDHPVDVSLPRRERKTGGRHKDFETVGDPDMSIHEAAARRDFTVNAIYARLPDGKIEDPFQGVEDLENKILRHTTERFCEDPLRVLRAMQFSARFGFRVHPETVALSRSLTQDGLSSERVFDEWKKLLLKGTNYTLGLGFLKDCGWLQFYPELEALDGCEQDPEWHPEGDVWVHTLHCLDSFARNRSGDEWEDLVVGLAVLCHDMGKPSTTIHKDGRVRSPGHAREGVEIAGDFIQRLTNQKQLLKEVLPLVKDHMAPLEFFNNQAGDSAIRRLADRVIRIDRLIRVAVADKGGRPPFLQPKSMPEGDWLLERAQALEVEDSAPKPILHGRHLLEFGFKPGPDLGRILKAAYEAQIDGAFENIDGALAWVRTNA